MIRLTENWQKIRQVTTWESPLITTKILEFNNSQNDLTLNHWVVGHGLRPKLLVLASQLTHIGETWPWLHWNPHYSPPSSLNVPDIILIFGCSLPKAICWVSISGSGKQIYKITKCSISGPRIIFSFESCQKCAPHFLCISSKLSHVWLWVISHFGPLLFYGCPTKSSAHLLKFPFRFSISVGQLAI